MWLGGLIILFILLFVTIIGFTTAHASTPLLPWSTEKSVDVIEGVSYSPNALPVDMYTERPCAKNSYSDSMGKLNHLCTVQTTGYQLTHDAKVLYPGAKSTIPLYNKLNTSSKLLPLTGSADLLEIQGKQASARLRLINNAYKNSSYEPKKSLSGIYITSTSQQDLYDKLNSTYLFTNYYLNMSKNNEWLVSQNGNGIYTYNIKNGDIQYIHNGYVTQYGYSPKLMLAISDSGRYVAVYTGRENKLEIVDTQICTNQQAKRGVDARCTSRLVMSDVKNAIDTLYLGNQLLNLQFESESTISFYAYTDWVGIQDFKLKKVFVSTANAATMRNLDYLALGDSYASGEGIGLYKDGTNNFGVNMCHVSTLSYPFQLANRRVVGDMESVACSGAKIKDIIRTNSKIYAENNPQANDYVDTKFINSVINNFYVGNTWQVEFSKQYQPKIITLSVGGNDIGFSKIIKTCIIDNSNCYSSTQQRKQLASIIQNTYGNLVKTYQTIKDTSPQSKIFIIGYPQIAKENGNCAANVGISNKEIVFTNKLISYLNFVIEKATLEAGVYYTDVEDAFNGRKLCEAPSNLVAVNGITQGNTSGLPKEAAYILGTSGPLSQESYHPNLIGHSMYAKTIQEKSNDFKNNAPEPLQQNIFESSNELLSLMEGGIDDFNYSDSAHYIYDESIAEDVLWRGKSATISIDSLQYGLTPNTDFTLVMYSEPTTLGVFETDDNGTLNVNVTIPANIPPGMHTLHLVGKSLGGEEIDIQKIVYVAATENDYDGDGIKNEDERCLIGTAANTDVDGDEIDDACDGYIGEPKITEEPPTTVPDPQPEQPPIEEPQQPSDKELPPSESRPDWLLMKERDNAHEQATANQSATIAPTTTTPIATVTTQSDNQPATLAPNTASEAPANEQPTASATTKQNTTVAGVSSAVESKPESRSNNVWYVYILLIISVLGGSIGFYHVISVKNRV